VTFGSTTSGDLVELALFRSHLATTVAWCRPRFNPNGVEQSLRSDALRPSHGMSFDDLEAIHRTVSSVVSRRESLVGNLRLAQLSIDGRLLGFYPRETIFDGVSAEETGGFIDGTNTPPWDTWVCMVEELLISWVPPQMVEDVDRAIVCNAEECIQWISEIRGDPFASELQANQLAW
jgi:hypothetical protein